MFRIVGADQADLERGQCRAPIAEAAKAINRNINLYNVSKYNEFEQPCLSAEKLCTIGTLAKSSAFSLRSAPLLKLWNVVV
jgi:hypothetical protein